VSDPSRAEPGPFLGILLHDDHHGPLPALLLCLTIVTGLVDAVSILSLGRVFVANMTGNVVFIGFALAGTPGFSLVASVSALAGFLVGAGVGGALWTRVKPDRGRLLLAGTGTELSLVVVGLVIVATGSTPYPSGVQAGAAGALGCALGTQNAFVRALAVPDLTTTVLTLTLTGLVADVRRGFGPASLRRALSVITMFSGAVLGAVLVLHGSPPLGLATATAVLLVVVVAASVLNRRDSPWRRHTA
jgi:uncharacterized membrane protein YoaK (UPF0700 family)